MNLNDYFSPVALNKPDESFYPEDYYISKNIYVNTPNTPIKDLDQFQIAIMGVPEDRNAEFKGSAKSPDSIREKLYLLRNISKDLKIIDLGNLHQGEKITDTYFGIEQVLVELIQNDLNVIIIGGSNDLELGVYMAFEKLKKQINALTIDPRIDYSPMNKMLSSYTYLNQIMEKDLLKMYTNIAHQIYFLDPDIEKRLAEKYFSSIRVGNVRSDMMSIEPLFRDANIVGFDVASIRQSDAPGANNGSPNGLYGEEACQLAKFAGLSTKSRIFGIYEVNANNDYINQTAHLSAQIIWYYMEGFSQRIIEDPLVTPSNFKQFIIGNKEDDIVFYKSDRTSRWWAKIPSHSESSYIISCTLKDYERASKNDIPERWLRIFRKINP